MNWITIANKAPENPINLKSTLVKIVIIVKIMDLINFSSSPGRKILKTIRKLIKVTMAPTITSPGESKDKDSMKTESIKKIKQIITLELSCWYSID